MTQTDTAGLLGNLTPPAADDKKAGKAHARAVQALLPVALGASRYSAWLTGQFEAEDPDKKIKRVAYPEQEAQIVAQILMYGDVKPEEAEKIGAMLNTSPEGVTHVFDQLPKHAHEYVQGILKNEGVLPKQRGGLEGVAIADHPRIVALRTTVDALGVDGRESARKWLEGQSATYTDVINIASLLRHLVTLEQALFARNSSVNNIDGLIAALKDPPQQKTAAAQLNTLFSYKHRDGTTLAQTLLDALAEGNDRKFPLVPVSVRGAINIPDPAAAVSLTPDKVGYVFRTETSGVQIGDRTMTVPKGSVRVHQGLVLSPAEQQTQLRKLIEALQRIQNIGRHIPQGHALYGIDDSIAAQQRLNALKDMQQTLSDLAQGRAPAPAHINALANGGVLLHEILDSEIPSQKPGGFAKSKKVPKKLWELMTTSPGELEPITHKGRHSGSALAQDLVVNQTNVQKLAGALREVQQILAVMHGRQAATT